MAEILTSWKEIATYLGKGVRTVQRWEHEMGLPVRRPPSGRKGIVLAHSEELEAWALSLDPNSFNNQSETERLRAQVKKLERECAQLKRELFMKTTIVS